MDYGNWLLQLVVHMLLAMRRIQCLLVTDINVPQIVDFRDNVTLSCSYDISGHTLNSVKWYKNEMEFFRYSPLMQPVYMSFPVQGVQLIDDGNECNESSCRVELNLLGIKSSGVYRCEVSGDAPHFKLTARAANMSVEALPQNNPLISSFHSMYHFDDFVQANCSTDFSSLFTKITWYINGVKVFLIDLLPSIETTITAHEYNLRRIVSQLNFYANDPRFHQLQLQELMIQRQQHKRVITPPKLGLELRCVAEIDRYPQLQREAIMYAQLFRDEMDLKNQKLINSKSVATPGMALPGYGLQLQLLLLLAVATTAARLLMPLTFQYGARKSARYKMTSVAPTAATMRR
ncbi:uncharacterized protein Dwil_GK12214 [Drosophila willistoni]|uniref:Ig-like domain-containing protein n=1 Tax=Drosophila willistoni TaxID=7260 RepID=B4N9W8_DROWI|nr:uncharacterized protein LOC6647727 [Drosophila willistoni]XP_046865340.1 uncharacterized protein LOC6647727 [Drosophila willistoni]EDW81723.1 uncharacterized protein Dwil_GK12214 [Drosophila willistoni]